MYRQDLDGDCHSKCHHPSIKDNVESSIGNLLQCFGKRAGNIFISKNPINVKVNEHGLKNGWGNFPYNFDPIWIQSCDGYRESEIDERT